MVLLETGKQYSISSNLAKDLKASATVARVVAIGDKVVSIKVGNRTHSIALSQAQRNLSPMRPGKGLFSFFDKQDRPVIKEIVSAEEEPVVTNPCVVEKVPLPVDTFSVQIIKLPIVAAVVEQEEKVALPVVAASFSLADTAPLADDDFDVVISPRITHKLVTSEVEEKISSPVDDFVIKVSAVPTIEKRVAFWDAMRRPTDRLEIQTNKLSSLDVYEVEDSISPIEDMLGIQVITIEKKEFTPNPIFSDAYWLEHRKSNYRTYDDARVTITEHHGPAKKKVPQKIQKPKQITIQSQDIYGESIDPF